MKKLLLIATLFFLGCNSDTPQEKNTTIQTQKTSNILVLDYYDANNSLNVIKLSKKTFKTDINKPVFLNFFSTRCKPCIAQMYSLKSLQEKYKDIEFIGVLVNQNISDASLKKFVSKMDLNYPIIANADVQKIKNELGLKINITPISMVFDSNGDYYTHYLGAVLQELIDLDLSSLTKAQ
ncbi:MAG: Thiol-disulfide isomerase-like thioredoxin [uncultured Campylobacterales bacterium]|uniref:Thiol-disulfide isomerase-like thioredoxin n=1 Tax=uncultured Campylobacterales bacterium TaxID=352960 RepID=A0A6S6ST93_9BACT|nr:MAG: Thiol-disulfide isomerase-like thioredoxin [uncultured Campylobacterales bacterium]